MYTIDSTVIDRSTDQREVNAACNAVIQFIDGIIEDMDVQDVIAVINDQLITVWYILDKAVRKNILITAFAEHDIEVHIA